MPAHSINKRVILRSNRFQLETITTELEDLGTQEHHLSQLVPAQAILTPHVGSIGERSVHLLSVATNSSTAASWIMLTSMPILPFRSAFIISKSIGGYYVPTSHPAPRNQIERCFKDSDFTVPPSWGKVVFMVRFVSTGSTGNAAPAQCYLVSLREGEFYRTDYPNVHSNGLICMGYIWDGNRAGNQPNMMLQFMHCLTTFLTSDMNPDLSTLGTVSAFSRQPTEPYAWRNDANVASIRNVISNAAFAPFSGMTQRIANVL